MCVCVCVLCVASMGLFAQADAISFTAAIRASDIRLWTHSFLLLQRLANRGMDPDVIIASSAINACEKHAQWQNAQLVLRQLRSIFVQDDVIVGNGIVGACAKKGEWLHGQLWLGNLRSNQVQPSVISYSSAITACEKGRMWQSACLLLEELTGQRLLNEIALNASWRQKKAACEDT